MAIASVCIAMVLIVPTWMNEEPMSEMANGDHPSAPRLGQHGLEKRSTAGSGSVVDFSARQPNVSADILLTTFRPDVVKTLFTLARDDELPDNTPPKNDGYAHIGGTAVVSERQIANVLQTHDETLRSQFGDEIVRTLNLLAESGALRDYIIAYQLKQQHKLGLLTPKMEPVE